MTTGGVYPGSDLVEFGRQLEARVPALCRSCALPRHIIDHALRVLYETKDPEQREEKKVVFKAELDSSVTRSNGEPCPGPELAYHTSPRLFYGPGELACQSVAISPGVIEPLRTPPNLVDEDACA